MYRQKVDFPLFSPPQITMDGAPSVQLKQFTVTYQVYCVNTKQIQIDTTKQRAG